MHVYTTFGNKFSLLRSGYITVYCRKSLLLFLQLPGSIYVPQYFLLGVQGNPSAPCVAAIVLYVDLRPTFLQAQSEMIKELLITGISPPFLCQELVAFQAGKSKLPLKSCIFRRFSLTMIHKKATSRKSSIAMDTALAL